MTAESRQRSLAPARDPGATGSVDLSPGDADPSGPVEATIRGVAVGAFVVSLPLTFIGYGIHIPGPLGTPEILAWTFLLGAWARMLWIVVSRQPRIMEFSFWLFVFVFFGVAALAQLQTGRYPIPGFLPSTSVILETQIRVIVGILAYVTGRALIAQRPSPTTVRWASVALNTRRVYLLTFAAILVCGYFAAKLGVGTFFTSRETFSRALVQGDYNPLSVHDLRTVPKASTTIIQLALLGPIFVALCYLIVTRAWRQRPLVFAIVVALNIIANNPLTVARYWFGVVVVGIVAASIKLNRRGRMVFPALGLLASLLYGFTLLNAFRFDPATGSAGPTGTEVLTASPDYSMFEQELIATEWIRQNGYTDGTQIMGAAFVFVPRAIWPGKAGNTGDLINPAAGFNVSTSLWTEFYIDFGYLALVAGFVAFGMLHSHLDRVFAFADGPFALVAIPIAAAYSVIFLRGSLQPIISTSLPVAVFLFFCVDRWRWRRYADSA